MRNFFKVIVFCSVLFTGGLSAQTLKFGHIEFQALIQSMPENLTARANVEKVQTSLEAQSTAMQKEAQEKYKEFIALSQAKDANEALVKVKQEEVQSIAGTHPKFQSNCSGESSERTGKTVSTCNRKSP
jgi:outer membrane protein